MKNIVSRMLSTKFIQQYSPSPALRRVARYRILKRFAKRNDFQIYKNNLIWTQDDDFLKQEGALHAVARIGLALLAGFTFICLAFSLGFIGRHLGLF